MSTGDTKQRAATTDELVRFLETVPPTPEGAPSSPGQPAGEFCPSADLYMDVALGACDLAKGQLLLNHASECSRCAQVLAASLRALQEDSDPLSHETKSHAFDKPAGAQPVYLQPAYQKELSRRLAASNARKAPILTLNLRNPRLWMGAAAAAVIAAAAVGVFLWQRHTGSPDRLLARAYQESRTLELRIPEASFATLKPGSHTRGAADEVESAALLEARAKLARSLQKSPQDSRNLELQARADLLEEHYDAAIDTLDRLIASGPVTAELLTDAAAAYFQRGLVSGRELDRSTALDYLRRADEMAPTDTVVLFNEAIVMQDRGQLMNAVEVWNRFGTIERDPQWAAEGKRKLAALETVLDRIKSHESRLMHMLMTPKAMDALAADPDKLATWDEELSSIELDKLLSAAFPQPANGQQTRASPCTERCLAARRLLYALARSLQIQHHDDWLNDLLPAHIESFSPENLAKYAEAMYLLGQATREDETGLPEKGEQEAAQARNLFRRSGRGDASLRRPSQVGELRAAAEYSFALQRTTDFTGCRNALHAERVAIGGTFNASVHTYYPWLAGFLQVTEKICNDTPETRSYGRAQLVDALQLTNVAHYSLLRSRIRLRQSADAAFVGDQEQAEEECMSILRDLLAIDAPTIRLAYTIASLTYDEYPSPRLYAAELQIREALEWCQLAEDLHDQIYGHEQLAMIEMRRNEMHAAQVDLQQAKRLAAKSSTENLDPMSPQFVTEMAIVLLERRDTAAASQAIDTLRSSIHSNSDTWVRTQYAAITGQFLLEQHRLREAEAVLEDEIRQREGRDVQKSDPVTSAGTAAEDHDLYGELAAAWLEDGREPAEVLAIWERFRLRSQSLPVHNCLSSHLNCEKGLIETELRQIGSNRMTGQILLMDRVLVYQMDATGIHWDTRRYPRQDVMDASQTLERAVSSPMISQATAELLGKRLGDALLPPLGTLSGDAILLLEPDPQLHNLAWPVLSTGQGPLGISFAIAETPSILAPAVTPEETAANRRSEADLPGRPFPGRSFPSRSLIIGASISAMEKAPLPEAIEEAESVGGFFHAPILLLGNQATTQSVAQQLPEATMLHFAGHAVWGNQGTRLLLAQSNPTESRTWIDGAFLEHHPPRRCLLAVLSACATGRQDGPSARPLEDLVETLSSLGVPQVIATRWQVDSAASVPLMKSFYSGLAAGHSIARALQLARKLQFNNSSYNNPYFWGAYFVTGRGQLHSGGWFYAGIEYAKNIKERPF